MKIDPEYIDIYSAQDGMYQHNEHLIFYTSKKQKDCLLHRTTTPLWLGLRTLLRVRPTVKRNIEELAEEDRQVQRLTLDVDDRCYTYPP